MCDSSRSKSRLNKEVVSDDPNEYRNINNRSMEIQLTKYCPVQAPPIRRAVSTITKWIHDQFMLLGRIHFANILNLSFSLTDTIVSSIHPTSVSQMFPANHACNENNQQFWRRSNTVVRINCYDHVIFCNGFLFYICFHWP